MKTSSKVAVVWLLGLSLLVSCSQTKSPVNISRLADYEAADNSIRQKFSAGFIELDDRKIPVTLGAAPGYVPDAVCNECHNDLAESYHHVGMSRAFTTPDADKLIADFEAEPYYHQASDRYYEMRLRDGSVVAKRYQIDDERQRYNEIKETVDFIMGSGNNARSYLYRTEVGELYQLPLTWYPKAGKWAMSPGYEAPDHPGYQRRIRFDCMFCHNSYPDLPAGSDLMSKPHRFPREIKQGLGCQRCHGPGAEHVAVSFGPATDEEIRSSIINLGELEPRLQDDVCLQCHLQPDAEMFSLVRKTDRGVFSYRPGQPLEDYLTPIDHSSVSKRSDRFQINHHAYRLYQSPCFVESDGQLNCLSCHDPHAKVTPDNGASHYRAVCLGCHQLDQCDTATMMSKPDGTKTANVDCIQCHMVRRQTHDVIEVEMTDHKIRKPDPEIESAHRLEVPTPGKPENHFPYWKDRGPSEELQIALARCLSGDQDRARKLRSTLDSGGNNSIDARLTVAGSLLNSSQYGEATALLKGVVQDEPDLAIAQELLGQSLIKQKKYKLGLAAMQLAWKLDNQSAATAYGLGLAYRRTGQGREAVKWFRKAIELRPYYPNALVKLGHELRKQKDFAGAKAAYAAVHQIDPRDEDGYYLHGLAELATKNTADAIKVWRRGLRFQPTSAQLNQAFATGLLIENRNDEAAGALAIAKENKGDSVNGYLLTAIIEHRRGKRQIARRNYQAALERRDNKSATPALRNLLLQMARQELAQP